MRIHSISTICRKCLMLLALLLASIQMVHAQEESGGTTTTEQKVYGEGDLIATDYAGGKGTKDDPWLISNDLELAKLAHDVTNGNTKLMFAGKYFKLTKDIDLSKGKWMPIGTWKCNKDNNDRYFAGKFDGDGHTISNMQIEWVNATGSEASWGLFNRLYGTSASSEATYASVTNLIIDNALIQKKKDTAPVGKSVIKIGTVAGDMTQFAEISNTIIRNSKITDNEETYNTPNSFRVGGVVGYIDNNVGNLFRIFNISADVNVNMLTQATLTSTTGSYQATISGGFGAVSKLAKPNSSNLVVLPRNILIHGKLKTSTTTAKCKKGSVMASNSGSMDFIDQIADGQPITSTWYYTAANKVTGSNDYKYGTEKSIDAIDENTGMTFGKTFVDQINQYISDKKLDRKSWAYLGKSKFAFSNIKLKAERGKQDVLTVVNEDGTTNSEKYDWYVSQDNIKWEKANTDNVACNPFYLPRQTYNQYVYAVSSQSSLRTNTIEVKAIGITAQLEDKTKPGTYIVNVTNDTEEKLSNEALGLTITYEWHNGIDPLTDIPLTQNEFTPTNTSHKYKYYCKVTVKSGDNILFKKNVCASVIVYLCPAGVTIGDVKYAVGKDDLTDDEWGYSPEKPMATWQGAYKKLSDKASWDENIIVLMGTSSYSVTQNGFNITTNYLGENLLTGEDWENAKTNHPELFRNATITGKWDKDYKGQIEIYGSSRGLPIWGDTRFEHITFNQNGVEKYKIIYCQYNNLEMGEGIKMTNFGVNELAYGSIDGAVTTPFHIFGGLNNDGRYQPLNTPELIKAFENSMPHGKEGFSITIKSGYYSIISTGGRQTATEGLNGVMGTPNQPIKCTITMDIDRKWNDANNEERTYNSKERGNDYDAGAILAGSHEGAMYADVDIIVKSGKVARVVNGTLGANTQLSFTYGKDNTTYYVPCNTYMGRANITIDPAKSEYNHDDNINGRVIITELYGGSMGRAHHDKATINNPFYGISNITINGGTFKVLPDENADNKEILCGIFGAGAGGMNGIGYGDDTATTHTPDANIAYWNAEKNVMLYGNYSVAKNNLVTYTCYNVNTESTVTIDPKDTQTNIIINGGEFGTKTQDGKTQDVKINAIDGIYAGGSGFMGLSLWTQETAKPSQYGGNVYGQKGKTVASLTINGGTFYCKNGIFGGGRGTNYFFAKKKYGGKNASDYKELGQTYGNVALNITGGTFYCPIYGGGYGVADTVNLDNKKIETLSNMARLYGKSTISIKGGTFYKNVYGGGDMAQTEDTELSISDYADIRGSVFAGGNGRKKRDKTSIVIKDDTWHPELVGRVTGSTSLTFSGSSAQAPSIYGNIYGGGNLAQVGENTNGENTNGEDTNKSSTTINIYGANFAGEIFGGGKGNITDSIGKPLASKDYTFADVNGNTNIYLAQDPGLQTREKDGNLKDNFSINVIWNKLWNDSIQNFYVWEKVEGENYKVDKKKFYDEANDKFLNPHNIYGGGNLACTVTGTATVNVQKGMTPYSLLKTQEWKESYDDNKHPHFSVFGGGYGENTSVGSTDVTVNVEGEYGEYNGEVDDDTEQLARPHRSKSKSKSKSTSKNKSKSTNKDTNKDMNVFDNSKGVPNFTILSALGGGYAGTVINDTKVTVDGNTFLHRVYGGGFGDPKATTADNKTGSIGGNTQVFVKGAYIHGDVFGGGAGVNPKEKSGIYTYFTQVAKVTGTTRVEISDEAKIYGSVFGGGDIANIGDEIKTPDYSSKPISESKIAQEDDAEGHKAGEFISYKAENNKTFVNLKGGDIFGEIFGGGKGLKKEKAPEYHKVGRINGNTLVHIVNTDAASSTELDYQNNVVPFVWNNVYGGCAYGTVDGNTLVHVEGGKLGQNIYGGGYGHVKVDLNGKETEAEKQKKTRQTVLGKKDTAQEGTYANILGNTQVQIDGGTWIWNRKADSKGNFTTWLAAQEDSEKICDNIEEFKEITAAILKAKTVDEITNEKAKAAINRIMNDENTQQFFEFTKGTMNSGSFKRNHNIYGGGNRACYVGTYTNDSTVVDKTGDAIVIVNHSPLTDIIIKNQDNSIKKLSLFDETSLPGLCWYISSKNTNDPEFSVFGAGFGANTKVGKTQVYVQPGAKINDYGILTIDGIKYRYLNQAEDHKTYFDFEMSIYNDFLKVSKEDKKLYFGSVTGSNPGEEGFDPMTYRRYHASRWAWILGLPGFTFQDIHGGGYSGYVTGDTYVETDAQPVCENIYGAGLGALPYGDFTDGKGYDFGKVGTSSRVFIKSGFIAQNVYGGGAGIESISNSNNEKNTWIDFPNMARVPKTEVHIYGRNFNYTANGKNLGTIDRTMIWGSVYGGGDVANVGNTEAGPDVFTYEQHKVPKNCTSLVNIRGGAIFSQVFAGGKGRLASECSSYQNLGGIYGNSCLVIDRPVISYPYYDETTKKALEPWSTEAMEHPAETVNANIIPTFHERIYGGCQNGTVYGNTFISIWDGYIGHGIYGGGWGNSDSETVNGEKTTSNGEKITSADVTGNTNMIIMGGKALLSSYWNPNTRSWNPASIINGITYSPQYNHETLKFKINHNIYGGGNEACEVRNNTNITIANGFLHKDTEVKPGQAKDLHFYQTAEWQEIYYKVGSPHFSIFGGGFGEDAIVDGNTNINIDMVRDKKIHFGIDFELGKEYEHFYNGYSYMDIVGGGYSGKVKGSTNIKGAGGVFCRRVFGGGFYSSVNSTNITVKAIDCHDIFGGGFMGDVEKSTNVIIGEDNSKTTTTSGNETSGDETSGTDTTTSGNNTSGEPSGKSPYDNTDIYIHGSVYGGNDVSGYVNIVLDSKGYFKENQGSGTNIKINGGHIYGNVYGAGNGNYLYANDRNGNTKVTVNEHYPLNPDDPNSEKVDLVYTVPMRETMPSIKAASDAAKIVNINSWRPLTNRVNIDITGNTGKVGENNQVNSQEGMVVIDGDVYGGGNSATVQKVYDDSHKKVGDIKINIGSHVNIRSVFMGSNGDELFTATAENDFMNMFQRLNGSVEDYTKELNLADSIDWVNDPSNKVISTLYLPTKNEDRPKVYPHLIDLYFHPVETDIQGTLTWNGSTTGEGLTDCTIGTFCCGGNRGNMNVYPKTAADFQESDTKKIGNVVDYIFPEGLTITDKIVGGCNNANYDYKGKATHTGGYLLGLAHSAYPFIKLTIKNKFEPKTDEKNNAYMGGNVYGGCYQSGTIKGDVTIDLQSDMLAGKNKTKLENSNNLLLQSAKYASLNIYGAGYGMESYVYGNTHILMGENIKCVAPTMNVDKANNVTLFNACGVVDETNNKEGLGVSANFVYGGGQQGNVIGITNVDILNGHVFRAVTGGSYSGYVYGSTQVKVGYPKYYKVRKDNHKGGRYVLKRTDQNQKNLKLTDNNGKTTSPTVKQHIYLLSDELITQGTREDIVAIDNGNNRIEITDADSDKYFTTVDAAEPKVGWDNVNINIDEAVYGGGYSLAQGSSVMANNTTVLKYTKDYNVDEAFTDTKEHLDELNGFPGGTTAGFGGNTVILVGDNKVSEHITISHQEMQEIKLPEGTDLFGYYYKHYDDDDAFNKGIYTYRFISLQDKYFYQAKQTPKLEGIKDNVFYEYDSEGGIFGDGHLSYAEGFRSTDVTGYGFAAHTIDNPKIINTFQRIDILRLEDNCFTLLGARDYTVNEINKTPYSIARVGEIKMVSNEIAYNTDGSLQAAKPDNIASFKYGIKARNYMGLSNNIHYVGAVVSDVPFNDKTNAPWRNHLGQVAAKDQESQKFKDMSYLEVKQKYIDDYNNAKKNNQVDVNAGDIFGTFQKRNDGTARNMIGIASGYAMKIQLCQVTYDATKQKVAEQQHYGPIYGVIEMNLINVREDEGGGYVYADNHHKRATGDSHDEDFLETTGNFVFPYKDGRYIVDDCFPTGYYSSNPDSLPDIHYWYVTGFHYYYNAHITGYTFKSSPNLPIKFNSDNKDGLTVLSGLKSGQTVRINSWKMRSGHPKDFSSDLEYRNYLKEGETGYNAAVAGGYQLYVGGSSDTEFNGATSKDDTDKQKKGFSALLEMNNAKTTDNVEIFNKTLPSGLTEDAKISFQLVDKVDNTNDAEADYFKKHLSEKSLATLVIKAPAYEIYKGENSTENKPIYAHTEKFFKKDENNNYIEIKSGKLDPANTYYQPQTDEYVKVEKLYVLDTTSKKYVEKALSSITIGDNEQVQYCVPREYTYTIYLTIEYVQGPTVSGNISIENCALPGEMIRINKKLVKIDADESFAANGYYWHIGKLKRDKDGKPEFEDGNTWVKDIFDKKDTPQNNTYQQGTATDNRTDLFAGTYYDKTEDYLEIPAYYFMNGYGVQLAISMTGFDKNLFTVPVQLSDTLVVHNYQEMDPQSDKVNLHIPEAVKRAKEAAEARANGEPQYFAEPRIYIKNQRDLTAFKEYLKEESNDGGAYAQFILQRDLSIGDNIDGTGATFKGTFHGNGHVLKGFSKDKALFLENQGQIYNLGLENGNIATYGCKEKGAYHCCFEYNPTNPTDPIGNTSPIVYRMDGTAEKGYTYDDFKYGKVAYDLNEYYLRARYSNDMTDPDDKAALKYIYDYYANGDYQYANRSDAYTGNNTGIVYLRTGGSSALTPNYGKSLTRHDQTHAIDKARAQGYTAATETKAESRTGDYLPLFNANLTKTEADGTGKDTEKMNDFLFWGQSLQLTPDNYPTEITSRQVDYMTNRVYRTAGYYGDTQLDAFHYNAYNSTTSQWDTYVYEPTTTAIDFTCQNDGSKLPGIFYPPVADNAQKYYDFMIKPEVTQNLLVYTAANSTEAADTEEANTTEAYDIVHTALNYDEEKKEVLIKGHHLVANKNSNGTGNGTADVFTTPYFHLVERTPEGKNSENDDCSNNDFCAPIPFTVTKHAWYVRKPMYYAEETRGAWEGISLPFTVNKVKAQINGEITHFYGTPSADELADPAKNTHTLHHEYWLRGLTGVNTGGNTGVNTGETTATFQRPGSKEAGLFQADKAASWNYSFKNDFFVRTYESKLYNKVDNPYYNEAHTYNDYLALTANIPYVVRFPGYRYYEFDLSSKFYNEYTQGLGIDTPAQTVTFHAYGTEYEPKDEEVVEKGAIEIPITASAGTLDVNGYSHMGTFKAQKVANGTIYGMNDKGTAFSDAFAETSPFATVMPFRTYLTPAATTSQARSSAAPSVIRIADTTGIEKIEPDVKITDDDDPSGNYLIVQPIGGRRIRIESTYATQLQVFSTTGQLYRILDVQPGTATYSGFYPSIYIFGNKKVIVR